jgi:hypothetical protein
MNRKQKDERFLDINLFRITSAGFIIKSSTNKNRNKKSNNAYDQNNKNNITNVFFSIISFQLYSLYIEMSTKLHKLKHEICMFLKRLPLLAI